MHTENDSLETLGRVKALRMVIDVLIATHPAPEKLHAAWHELLAAELDATRPFDEKLPEANAALRQLTDRFSRLIDAAAAPR